MRLIKGTLLFICVFMLSLVVTAENANAWGKKRSTSASVSISSKKVSDSLVNELSCQKLSIDNIYRAIKPEAFSSNLHMPVRNWDFRSGLATLGGCWGLSSTQRMLFYLARYDEPTRLRVEEQVPPLLDLIRGETLYLLKDDNNGPDRIASRKLKKYQVFPIEKNSLQEDWWHPTSLWGKLMEGYVQNVEGRKVRRHFREEIQANQGRHFYRIGNVGMAAGSGARSGDENADTVQQLRHNLDGKRLTLVNLRPGRTSQHIVVVKSYTISQGIITFKVYDSNAPEKDWDLKYSVARRTFYAPEVVDRIADVSGYTALGVYVVDEEEREAFEDAMLAHYKVKCR